MSTIQRSKRLVHISNTAIFIANIVPKSKGGTILLHHRVEHVDVSTIPYSIICHHDIFSITFPPLKVGHFGSIYRISPFKSQKDVK